MSNNDAMANMAVNACPIELGLFFGTAKTFDLAFEREEKINAKCKALAMRLGALAGVSLPPYLP